jgi:hypothetical protein
MAGDGSTKATTSGGASAVAETEKKKNKTTTVLDLYRATKKTSRRHAARREHAEAGAGDRGHVWKGFEDRWRRVGGGALLLAGFQLNYENATRDNSQVTQIFSIEAENL